MATNKRKQEHIYYCYNKEKGGAFSRHGYISDVSLRRLKQRLRDTSERADLQISKTSPG